VQPDAQAVGVNVHPQRGAYSLRPARAGDQAPIRRLVYQARLNPRRLDWCRFVVAVDAHDRIVGCGQIKPHRDGSRELASIVVHPGWREGGVASALLAHLLRTGPPLWLVCRARLAPFYQRFGFREVLVPTASSPHFRRILRFGQWLKRIVPPGQAPCVMVWVATNPAPSKAARLQAE